MLGLYLTNVSNAIQNLFGVLVAQFKEGHMRFKPRLVNGNFWLSC